MKATSRNVLFPRWDLLALTGVVGLGACTPESAVVEHRQPLVLEAPAQSIFANETPQFANAADGVSYDLGIKVRPLAQGRLYALRYWKAPSEVLPDGVNFHLGKVYGPDGEILGIAKFENETASGWQEAALQKPIALSLGKTYTVVVDAYSHYVATNDAFVQPLRSGKLEVVADGANGVYGPIWEAPTNSFRNSNYFRDVVFSKLISVNVGGGVVGSFNGEAFTGPRSGLAVSNDAAIDVAGVANAAAPAVYRSARLCDATGTESCNFLVTGLDGDGQPTLTPGAMYEVRLHFAEILGATVGQRQFNISINGQQVLTNFDIRAEAGDGGASARAVVRSFETTATRRFTSGEILIQLTRGNSAPLLAGFEIIPRS
jgi:hypothetical protein